jgi:hypothetical protein
MASHTRAFAALLTGTILVSSPAWAEEELCPGLQEALAKPLGDDTRELFISNFTKHWSPSDEHKRVLAMSLQQELVNHRFCGFSLFTNSFGQPSAYVYIGKSWPGIFPAVPKLFASVSAGVLYGYVSPYKNKVPANFDGFSPAIVPTLGYQLTPHVALQTQWLGFAAVMLGASWRY